MVHDPCWISSYNIVWGNITADNSPHANDCSMTDVNTSPNLRAMADPNIVANYSSGHMGKRVFCELPAKCVSVREKDRAG